MHKEIVRVFDKILFIHYFKEKGNFFAGIGFGNSVIEFEVYKKELYAWIWKDLSKNKGYSLVFSSERKNEFLSPRRRELLGIKFNKHD